MKVVIRSCSIMNHEHHLVPELALGADSTRIRFYKLKLR